MQQHPLAQTLACFPPKQISSIGYRHEALSSEGVAIFFHPFFQSNIAIKVLADYDKTPLFYDKTPIFYLQTENAFRHDCSKLIIASQTAEISPPAPPIITIY